MISKEFTSQKPTAKHLLAGWTAEKQMAFYLDRAFGRRDDVRLFHNVRYDLEGDFAQIDHLVLHRFGLCIVESKSMVGKVTVDQHGEFTRDPGDGRGVAGIASPILQAKRQVQVLSELLNNHKTDLRRIVRLAGQAWFGEERFRVFAALSDHSIIERKNTDPPELMKADRVTDAIDSHIKSHQSLRGLRGFVRYARQKELPVEPLGPFTDEEMESIAYFLIEHDTLLRGRAATSGATKPQPASPKPAETKSEPAPTKASSATQVRETRAPLKADAPPPPATTSHSCYKCQSTKVEIRYGRNYYFKCLDCDGNTPIKQECPACGEKARLKKSGPTFRWNCAGCGCGDVFFVNGEG